MAVTGPEPDTQVAETGTQSMGKHSPSLGHQVVDLSHQPDGPGSGPQREVITEREGHHRGPAWFGDLEEGLPREGVA